MKLLITQFSPASCHFISLRSKCSPQHPVLKHPQSMAEKTTHMKPYLRKAESCTGHAVVTFSGNEYVLISKLYSFYLSPLTFACHVHRWELVSYQWVMTDEAEGRHVHFEQMEALSSVANAQWPLIFIF
jgi:hypothetical protein